MFKKITYGLSILVAVCILVISMGGKGMAASLSDIPAKYSSEVNYLMQRSVVTGYPDSTFRPNLDVTREEAATMIGRALGLNGDKRQTGFSDVSKDSYASGYIQSAADKGIITGDAEGTFRPKDKMTRGEMAYLLKRAFELSETSNVFFSDVAASGAQYTAINNIVTAGLSNGYPDGSFKPGNAITRVEFSLFTARGLDQSFRVSEADLKPSGVKYVTATDLNVRTGPGTGYNVVGSLPQDAEVTIYYSQGDWVYASSGSLKGFVHSGYLADSLEPVVKPSGKRIIAIDPGHGGKDPGAISNGIYEKELNLSVSLKVRNILQQKGIQVVMTRTGDTYPTLGQRVDIAVNAKADSFVSIHGNTNGSSSPSGTETYYSTAALSDRAESSRQLATFIQNRLYKAIDTQNRGVKTANFQVIRYNPLPSVLVELGFLSNKSDAAKLSSDAYRNKMAEAIALGIVDYYNWKE
ncbi:N-acetylmuramoyl-L-alanine amidase [Bacillus infantis]|uniref:N-acetylmuramoyl-L-alanine amidase n=1 Tax=Bacillus infantis TaxID=324767 RepID=UPI001CD6F46B|nr:N-acetylmuramoyl-L-alanine amidase [Bacillus infantis]MCA1041632.1 N-acetylmuramoyl-L-alanine amidase [Bacillus infantis]